jgi:hypothetical protein
MAHKAFDPMDGLSTEDSAYLESQRKAKERQEGAWEGFVGETETDTSRRLAGEEHRRKTMADHGVTPADLVQNGQQGPAAALVDPTAVAGALPARAGVPTSFSVLRAMPAIAEKELPQANEQFAPDWAEMKKRIAPHDGTWIVEKYEFHPDVALILGFFGKEGWAAPDDAKKEEFEVIVKGGRVFRTDPE